MYLKKPLLRGPQQWVLNILAEDCFKEELQVPGNEWFLLGNLVQFNTCN